MVGQFRFIFASLESIGIFDRALYIFERTRHDFRFLFVIVVVCLERDAIGDE